MTAYVLKLGGVAIALLLAGVLAFVVFGSIWARIGIVAAIVIVVGGSSSSRGTSIARSASGGRA
jgi:hypothetical protein